MCLALCPITVSADSFNSQKDSLKKEIFDGLKNNPQMREKYKNIVIPTKQVMKKVLMDEFRKNPIGNRDNITKVDELVDQFIEFFKIVKEYDLTTQDFRWYPHYHTWKSGPSLTKTIRTTHYGEIHERDNRTSEVPVEVTFSSSISATVSVGFSGSVDIKEALNLSINASGSYTFSQDVSEKVTVPAFTYWSRQAYAYKKTSTYSGVQETYSVIPSNPVPIVELVETKTQTATNSDGDGGGVNYKTMK